MANALQNPRFDRTETGVLHLSFALTGVLHAAGGPLLPSIAARLHLSDARSGMLFLLYFIGTSLGALLCVRSYARVAAAGFFLVALCTVAIAFAGQVLLLPLFFLLGVGVGIPMSAVSMIAGQRFRERSAAPLTLLNFSWSAGALLAPLLAARALIHHDYRVAYLTLGAAAAGTAISCFSIQQNDVEGPACEAVVRAHGAVRWILLIAFLTFLEVGIENTSVTWLATFALRTSAGGAAHAAASSSLYWIGFLASRGISSILLMRFPPLRVLTCAVLGGIAGSFVLITLSSATGRDAGMIVLGASLAPIFPLLLSQFFARERNASQARWVLACCGFGGSVLPWVTGFVSTCTGSLGYGLLVVPVALMVVLFALPALRTKTLAAA